MSQPRDNSRHVIWSNIDLNFDDWKGNLKEQYPNKSEQKLTEIMYEINADYLYDERDNLNIPLDKPILIIADLGLWYGRRSGYKEIPSGNIKDCLYSETDYTEWFVDKFGDLRADAIHHDGTNHYLYRVYKDNAAEAQIDNLKNKICNGTATRKDITKVTKRLGDDIAKVYGWDIPKTTRNKEKQKER